MTRIVTRHKTLFTMVLISGLVALSAFNALGVKERKVPLEEGAAKSAVPTSDFTNFESGHVHPIDMTPDGTKLLAVNTANNSLEVFQLGGPMLLNVASIPVGLDPVTVRVRSNTEAWVVDQVSDEISIVDLTTNRVVRSLATEDEPADVVFAGSPLKAFVSLCATGKRAGVRPGQPGERAHRSVAEGRTTSCTGREPRWLHRVLRLLRERQRHYGHQWQQLHGLGCLLATRRLHHHHQ
jgi:YVTN family beta-propeller protein